jgi:cation transport regulator ChaC
MENVHAYSASSPHPHEPFELVIYVGTEDNKYFAGAADIECIAQQIVDSVGPSGTNKEYLYKLASAMRLLAPGVQDEHLFALEEAVRHLENLQS